MAGSLKEKNKRSLLIIVAANLIAFYVISHLDAIQQGEWFRISQELIKLLPAGFGIILVGIINAQLSALTKTRIVFFRWKCPMPGCEAFTRYAPSDPRIDLNALRRRYGPFPTDPNKQNSLWYKLYKSVEDHPAVSHVHQEFSFTRDYSSLALMMLVLFGGIGLWQIRPVEIMLVYLGALIIQYILTMRAARNHGQRFVTNVLALKSAEQE